MGARKGVIPPERIYYLSEIAATVREYHAGHEAIAQQLRLCQHLETAAKHATERERKPSLLTYKLRLMKSLNRLKMPVKIC